MKIGALGIREMDNHLWGTVDSNGSFYRRNHHWKQKREPRPQPKERPLGSQQWLLLPKAMCYLNPKVANHWSETTPFGNIC